MADLARIRRTRPWELPEMRWAAAALALFLVGLAAWSGGMPAWSYWAAYLACYATGGWEPALAGLRALRHRTLDVDLLMVVAALGAAAIGQITDGALLIVIFATSGALEALATARTGDSVRGLLDLAPDTAVRVGPDGVERRVRAAELAVGDTVVVRPGERVPADGTVVGGASEVDRSTVTGEPLPVDAAPGDSVYAGTRNGTGVLRVRVDKDPGASVVARIAAMVAEASDTKARTQLMIERIEQRYSIGMVAVTLAVFVIPLFFGDPLDRALLRAMTFMIVASPCAVVLATMPPLLAAMATASRGGVLVKSAVAMERLAAVTAVAFDKTGTLTLGSPEVSRTYSAATDLDEGEVLRLAAAVEGGSEHPLGAAITAAADRAGLDTAVASGFVATPGRGVAGTVGGRRVTVESATGPAGDAMSEAAAVAVSESHARGETAVLVTVDGRTVGVIALSDRLRPEAPAAVAATAAVTGTPPSVLTGDNRAAATALARRVGAGAVVAECLPEDKVAALRSMSAAGATVAMVGDGINDAPALAVADVGIAIGGAASDLALQTADVVVVRDDLRGVPAVLRSARRARRVAVANLALAATGIGALVVWDLVGTLPLPLGVAGHEGSTILVCLNGLRLLRRGPDPATARVGGPLPGRIREVRAAARSA
ncbi:heavy metal translocating P-type ATPase [Tsukamurella soli]|uniref:Heavy metal translocating P-type ATPase n=1 Tax=Tsukamurella soli TaxID=644556 RepID=A0ABP8K8Q8_9ACTN